MTPNNEELQRKIIEDEVLQAIKPLIPNGLHPHVRLVAASDCPDNQGSAASPLKAGDSIVISFDSESDSSAKESEPIRFPRRSRTRDFKPITIRGEPLSATVIRDRG